MTMTMYALELDEKAWIAVNDGVMGGRSESRMVAVDDSLLFSGLLSLENSGGFASVRRIIDAPLADADRVRLRLKGDGRSYQFRLRQDPNFDGIAWRAVFATSGEWETVDLPLGDFQPVFRGRPVAGAGPVNAGRIRQAGFMLADGKPGPFRLEIRAIEFVGRSDQEP